MGAPCATRRGRSSWTWGTRRWRKDVRPSAARGVTGRGPRSREVGAAQRTRPEPEEASTHQDIPDAKAPAFSFAMHAENRRVVDQETGPRSAPPARSTEPVLRSKTASRPLPPAAATQPGPTRSESQGTSRSLSPGRRSMGFAQIAVWSAAKTRSVQRIGDWVLEPNGRLQPVAAGPRRAGRGSVPGSQPSPILAHALTLTARPWPRIPFHLGVRVRRGRTPRRVCGGGLLSPAVARLGATRPPRVQDARSGSPIILMGRGGPAESSALQPFDIAGARATARNVLQGRV